MLCKIIKSDCEQFLKRKLSDKFDLTFVDPPFNQNKYYASHADNMSPSDYWDWMKRVCALIFEHTSLGGAIYFMQREINTQFVIKTLISSGWTFQNLIIWKKKTSAVPGQKRFGKHYQIIAFATKGKTPRVFNRLRINPPLLVTEKHPRPEGRYITDVWDDIRELTSGYFAGNEPFRLESGERIHKQQSPVQLLLRIILSSSKVGDMIFDPFAGTGTILVVAKQLQRKSLGIEIDPANVSLIANRISYLRDIDDIKIYRRDYIFTKNLVDIFPFQENEKQFALDLKCIKSEYPWLLKSK